MKHDIIEELFKKYYNDALLYTLSLTKNYPLAEEIVSDTFFIALKTSDEEILNFKSWLLKVCRNLYLNSLRKSKRHQIYDDNVISESEHIIDNLIRDDEYKALHHAISLLGDLQKEILTLFYFEDMSVKEISIITKKSEEVVKVTLFRAREALKKILTKNM